MITSNFLHGGDYNPEQWLDSPDILEQDIKLLKKAKCNVVTLGVFSWAMLEPMEGKFDFTWMEEIIDRLYENGISIILATPSGARPKWLSDKYSEVLRVDSHRHRDFYGKRHNHCYTSPIYREKVKIINTELAKRFANHKAVLLWHISNEYGGECHCPLCQQKFREWLRKRYTTIEELNIKWYTTFWSHNYQNFDQIESPSPEGEDSLHALNLDWKRFVTDQTIDFMQHEILCLKPYNNKIPITTNMMYFYETLNYNKFKDLVDIISWDSYPMWHANKEWITATEHGIYHDLMRSIKKQPFLLMESTPSSLNWSPVNKLKKPGIHELASLQAIAHGSDSVLYFQIRQSRGAGEKFHGAVIDHYGGDTRVLREVSEVGNVLEKISSIVSAEMKADVAIIYDWENSWAIKDSQGPRNCGLSYEDTVRKSYNAFRKQGMNVDVVDMEQEINEYCIVVAPLLYMLRAGFAKKVQDFVHKGGIFIVTYWSGMVDENDRCFLGGTPHDLMEVVGLRSMEIDGLYDGECNKALPLQNNSLQIKNSYICSNLCELVELSTATAIMSYASDFYCNMPVFTENQYGAGRAYYICADMEQSFYDDIYQIIVKKYNIPVIINTEIPEGVEVTMRQTNQAKFIFIQNFHSYEVEINIDLNENEILFGEYLNKKIKGYGTIILKK